MAIKYSKTMGAVDTVVSPDGWVSYGNGSSHVGVYIEQGSSSLYFTVKEIPALKAAIDKAIEEGGKQAERDAAEKAKRDQKESK